MGNTRVSLANFNLNADFYTGYGYEPGEYVAPTGSEYDLYGTDETAPFVPNSETSYYSNRVIDAHHILAFDGISYGGTIPATEYYGLSTMVYRYSSTYPSSWTYRSIPWVMGNGSGNINLTSDSSASSDIQHTENIAISYLLTSTDIDWSIRQDGVYAASLHGGPGLDETNTNYEEAFDYARFYEKVSENLGNFGLENGVDPEILGGGVAVNSGSLMFGPFSIKYNDQTVSDDLVFGGISDLYLKGYYQEGYYYDADGDPETEEDNQTYGQDPAQVVNERIGIDPSNYGQILYWIGSGSARSLNFFTPDRFYVDQANEQSYPASCQQFYLQVDKIPTADGQHTYQRSPNNPRYATDPNPTISDSTQVSYVTLCVEFKWCSLGSVNINEAAIYEDIGLLSIAVQGRSGWTGCSCRPCHCRDHEPGEPAPSCTCSHYYQYANRLSAHVLDEQLLSHVWNASGSRELYGMALEGSAGIRPANMQLGGYVWEEGQGGKENIGDGLRDIGISTVDGNDYSPVDKPIKGIKVVLQVRNSSGSFSNYRTAYTNTSGRYSFTSLNPLNKYRVVFEYNGQLYMPTDYLKTGTIKVSDNSVTSGQTLYIEGSEEVETLHSNSASANYANGYNWRINSKALEPSQTNNPTNGEWQLTRAEYDHIRQIINSTNKASYKSEHSNQESNRTDNGTYIEVVAPESINAMKAYTQNFDGNIDVYPIYDAYQASGNMQGDSLAVGTDFDVTDTSSTETIDPTTGIVELGTVTTNNNLGDGLHNYINLGLCLRPQTDVALIEDVYKAAIKVKGHTEIYNYNRNDVTGGDVWEIDVRRSDANYGDYYGSNYNREVFIADANYSDPVDPDRNLEVYITYRITVRNQSQQVLSEIKEIVNYYDKSYVLMPNMSWVMYGTDNEKRLPIQEFTDIMNNESLPSDAKFRALGGSDTSAPGYLQNTLTEYNNLYIAGLDNYRLAVGEEAYIYLTFKVDNNTITTTSDGQRISISEINAYSNYYPDGTEMPNGVLVTGGNLTQTLQIYNNNGTVHLVGPRDVRTGDYVGDYAGLIDIDSNPGNFVQSYLDNSTEERPYEFDFEDDTDRAKGIKVFIEDDAIRKINGTVWEDNRSDDGLKLEVEGANIGNGKLDSGEQGVAGVTVELHEVLEQNVSGVNQLVTQDDVAKVFDGTNWVDGKTTTDENGNYSITGFMPGNYIVRFIYPNGQDYKSTIYQTGLDQPGTDTRRDGMVVPGYANYENQNSSATYGYNIAKADELEASGTYVSDAKDIWTERERVNQYGNNDGNGVTYDRAKDLVDETNTQLQMIAETGVIRMAIEYNRETTEMTQTIDYNVDHLDFGMVERPKAGLTLDKKVTNVKVTLSDQRVLFDTTQSADNLIWTRKTDSNKGLIQIIMDEEITYGSTIQVTYEFEIKNVGEIDYNDKQFYYAGSVSDLSTIVKTSADMVVDYVSNNIQFRSGDNATHWVENKNIDLEPEVKNKLSKYNSVITTEDFKQGLKPGDTVSKDLILTQTITSRDQMTYDNITEIIQTSNDVGRRMETTDGNDVIQGNQDPEEDPEEQDSSESEGISIVPPYGQSYYYIGLALAVIAVLTIGIVIIIKKVLKRKE